MIKKYSSYNKHLIKEFYSEKHEYGTVYSLKHRTYEAQMLITNDNSFSCKFRCAYDKGTKFISVESDERRIKNNKKFKKYVIQVTYILHFLVTHYGLNNVHNCYDSKPALSMLRNKIKLKESFPDILGEYTMDHV